jgi:hypothetical protein
LCRLVKSFWKTLKIISAHKVLIRMFRTFKKSIFEHCPFCMGLFRQSSFNAKSLLTVSVKMWFVLHFYSGWLFLNTHLYWAVTWRRLWHQKTSTAKTLQYITLIYWHFLSILTLGGCSAQQYFLILSTNNFLRHIRKV